MKRLEPVHYALLAVAAALIALIAWPYVAGNGRDRLSPEQAAASHAESDQAVQRCTSQATFDLIKRELFRRAAQLRGPDPAPTAEPLVSTTGFAPIDAATFEQVAARAVLRMESAAFETEDEKQGLISCTGSLAIDLPPGFALAGGKNNISSDVDYALRSAPDGSTAVVLPNADAVIGALAGVLRVVAVPDAAAQAVGDAAAPDEPDSGPAVVLPPEEAPAQPPPAPAVRTSFDCSRARTRGEQMVCADPGLAGLDRQMAGQYRDAVADATPQQRAMLAQSRDRFLTYRDRCPTPACVADTYLGRMREIRDIMAGRFQAPR